MRNDTPISDDGPSSLLGPEQVEHLEFTAKAMEKKLDYGEKGINMAMDKLHDINRAHLRIGKLQAEEARVLAEHARSNRQLTEAAIRIAAIQAIPNAINDADLCEQVSYLSKNKAILEKLLQELPEQLKIIQRIMPLAINEAKQFEDSAGAMGKALHDWRQLAANLGAWQIEGEPLQVIMHHGINGISDA